jgi:hypothetical protein
MKDAISGSTGVGSRSPVSVLLFATTLLVALEGAGCSLGETSVDECLNVVSPFPIYEDSSSAAHPASVSLLGLI